MSERLGPGVMETTEWAARSPQHLGHGEHLCHLVEDMGISIDQYKKLIKNPKFLCKKCGRVAARAENLCEPIKL